jgi:hypothetical protein
MLLILTIDAILIEGEDHNLNHYIDGQRKKIIIFIVN